MSPEAIEGLVRDHGYGVILFGTYFDHYGIPLFLVFGGIAASKDILNLYVVLLCGFAGGWIGDLFLYFLGYKTGLQYWMQFAFVRKLAKPVATTDRLFKTRPATMVVLGRFLFAVSKIIPPFAGMVRYDVKRYVLYSFLGNVLYSAVYAWSSFLVGPYVLKSLKELKAANILITALFVLAMFWLGKKALKTSRIPGGI
ncbi:MAG: VTT domain-containing protein [Nitrospinae bacterium]|nr:VTT domain-containing protein [Nitrospinota bacterium]